MHAPMARVMQREDELSTTFEIFGIVLVALAAVRDTIKLALLGIPIHVVMIFRQLTADAEPDIARMVLVDP